MPKETLTDRWCLFARLLCRLFCRLFFRMRFVGMENIPGKGPFIFVVNHQSFFDPIFAGIMLKIQLCFMARDSLFTGKITGPILRSVKAIPVRRGQADLASIKAIIARLKDGDSVCLFPEATRTADGKIAPFKGGFSLLARRGNAPVIPVLIDGAFECWPRQRKLFKIGSKITIAYGKPIPVEKITSMEDEDFAAMLTATMIQMQSEERISQGKQPFSY